MAKANGTEVEKLLTRKATDYRLLKEEKKNKEIERAEDGKDRK